MAQVEYAFPIEKINGKIGKKHKIGFAHYKASGKNGTVAYGQRTTPVTSHEQELREKFAAATAATLTRMRDPNQVAEDQAAFANQKKYATLRGYIFAQEYKKLGE